MKPGLFDIYADQTDVLGEGPIWSAAERALYWLDIARKTLYRRAPADSRSREWPLPDYPGCIAELGARQLAVAMGEGIQSFSLDSGTSRLLCAPEGRRRGTRFNDGKVDPRGRFWVGTMQNNFGPNGGSIPIERADGSLFRFGVDGSVCTLEEDIGVSNTLAWSVEQRRFYFADSMQGALYVYDYDDASGDVRNKRILFDAAAFGIPDGSAIDVDGCLWNARWDGAAILRITPEGKVDRRIELPVPRPTSCIFGGEGFETLFVTSARQGLSLSELQKFPHSGSVFALHGISQGLGVPAFARPTGLPFIPML